MNNSEFYSQDHLNDAELYANVIENNQEDNLEIEELNQQAIDITQVQLEELAQMNKKKIRNKKWLKQDTSLEILNTIDNINSVEDLSIKKELILKECNKARQKQKLLIIKQIQQKNQVKNLDKFKKKNFLRTKYNFEYFQTNKFNLVCTQLLKMNDTSKSYVILLAEYTNCKFNWINHLDFNQQQIQEKLRKVINKFKQNDIQYDFLQLIQILIQKFKENENQNENQIYEMHQQNLNYESIYSIIQWDQNIDENNDQNKQVENNYQNKQLEILELLKLITESKFQRYFQKQQINFSKQTIKNLVNGGAKSELDKCIQQVIDNPTCLFTNKKIDDDLKKNVINQFQKLKSEVNEIEIQKLKSEDKEIKKKISKRQRKINIFKYKIDIQQAEFFI